MSFDLFREVDTCCYLDNYGFRNYVKDLERSTIKLYIDFIRPLIHYTSADGLLGILRSNKLRFTEASCLNDELEGNVIFENLREILKSYSIDFRDEINQERMLWKQFVYHL